MYVVRFGLKPNGNELKEAEKRFSVMNKLHNVLVSHAKKLLNRLDKDHGYQDMLEEYHALKKKNDRDGADDARMEALGDDMDAFRGGIGLTEGGLESYVKVWQERHAKLVSSQQAQCEADRVWQGVEAVPFGKGEDIHFRKISEIHTIGGKSNINGTKFSYEDMSIDWTGLRLKCYADWNDDYIRAALCLDNPQGLPEISYCQVEREAFEGGCHYYVLVYFRGTAPLKGRTCGEGDFGLDPGVSMMAGVSDKELFLEELAPGVKKYDKRIADLQERMGMSKRAKNPDNFNPDGTVKPKKDRKPWVFSEHYNRLLWQLRIRTGCALPM